MPGTLRVRQVYRGWDINNTHGHTHLGVIQSGHFIYRHVLGRRKLDNAEETHMDMGRTSTETPHTQ